MAEIIQEQAIIGEQPAGESNPSVVGDLRLHEFQSHIFANTRMLRVWLPPEYDDPVNLLRYYPVFYLNDGQNLFDRGRASPGVEWQVDETAVRQWAERIFLVIGTRESENEVLVKEIVDDVRELEHILRRAGLGEQRLLVKIDEGAIHSEGDWARRFPGALKFLFEKKKNQAM